MHTYLCGSMLLIMWTFLVIGWDLWYLLIIKTEKTFNMINCKQDEMNFFTPIFKFDWVTIFVSVALLSRCLQCKMSTNLWIDQSFWLFQHIKFDSLYCADPVKPESGQYLQHRRDQILIVWNCQLTLVGNVVDVLQICLDVSQIL